MAGLEARTLRTTRLEQVADWGDAMATKKKDLSASKDVKGGRPIPSNDNLTLVRAAKPAKKDLPAGKDVKGGKKAAK